MADAGQKHLTLEEVALITQQALTASGLSATATSAITDVVTQAERDECHSHGLFRVPGYCSGVIAGKVNGTAEPVVHDVAPGVVRVDACGGYAPSAILAGREAAVAKVRQNGVACLAIQNSAHFAALWWEVESLARDGIGVTGAWHIYIFVVSHHPVEGFHHRVDANHSERCAGWRACWWRQCRWHS